MAPTNEESFGEKQPMIRRGRVDSLPLYEITDNELDILEKGTPDSVYLNFSIFFLSIAASFTFSVLTTKIESIKLYTFFIVILAIAYAAGFVLLAIWWRNRSVVAIVVKKIRGRVPPFASEAPSQDVSTKKVTA